MRATEQQSAKRGTTKMRGAMFLGARRGRDTLKNRVVRGQAAWTAHLTSSFFSTSPSDSIIHASHSLFHSQVPSYSSLPAITLHNPSANGAAVARRKK